MAEIRKRRRLSGGSNPEPGRDIQADSPVKGTVEDALPSTAKPAQRRTIFVRSLPPSATTETLTEHFSQSFPLKHATVVVDPKTRQSKGYGFVTFADHEDAQRALEEFNGTVFDGRKLKIEIAEPRHRETDNEREHNDVSNVSKLKEEKEKRKLEAQPPKLIVRNLPWSITTQEQLAVLFRSYGKVKHAVVPKKGNKQTGFGFVVMRGRKNAEKAIEGVNGKEIDGRTLAVDWAVEKSVWEGIQKPTEEPADDSGKHMEADAATEDKVDGGMEVDEGVATFSEDDSDEVPEDDDISMSDASEKEDEEEEAEIEDERNASTVFIRNLPFTATDDSLYEHFTQFGPLRYARVVLDHETDRPRGTAFVCFYKVEDAFSCLREAPRRTDSLSEESKKQSSKTVKHSILEDENKDPSGRYTMDGRVLQISAAVSRTKAAKLEAEGSERRETRDKDKRRLYLLQEGTISKDSSLYSKLSPSEVKMREASAKQRQSLVKSNPMLHLSLTRLSVRNIPRSIDSKALKALAREAVVGFAKDVKMDIRQPLSKEELSRNTQEMKDADKLRKSQGKGIVKQAKVVFEGRDGSKISEGTGAGRSRGYGFIEYTTHRSALMGLRWLNGHAVAPSASTGNDGPEEKGKRLIVEFAIENAQVVKRRQELESKARTRGRENKSGNREGSKSTDGVSNSVKAGGKRGTKRKRSESAPKGKTSDATASSKSSEKKATGGKDNQLAKRNRIIAKKRMMRKARKG